VTVAGEFRNRSTFRIPDEGQRDLSLPYLRRADFEEMNALIPGGLPTPPNKQCARAIASMAAVLVTQANIDPDVYYSCSRSHDWWADARRYQGTSYTYASAVWAMDALSNAGIIGDLQIAPQRAPRRKKDGTVEQTFQSRFRPSDRLCGLALPTIRIEKGETIILKDRAGHLMPYKDTERTHRMRRFVEAFNEAEACWDIQLPASGAVKEGYLLRFLPTDEGDAEFVVNTTLRTLFRVFNHGVWTKGGRYYGGWWQGVRSRDRTFFILNGSEIDELDIKHCHPELLYAKAELRLDGDAYDLGGGWTRDQGKQAFNTLLNSANYQEALYSIANQVFHGEIDPAAMIIRHVRRRHPKIDERGLFCSGAGLELMNADAEVCHDVLRDLAIKAKVPVLPVHDSFIVRKRDVGLLREAMDRALAKQGVQSRVGVSSAGSTTYHGNILHSQRMCEEGRQSGGTGWGRSETCASVRPYEGLVGPLIPSVEWDEAHWASIFDEAATYRDPVGEVEQVGNEATSTWVTTQSSLFLSTPALRKRPVRAFRIRAFHPSWAAPWSPKDRHPVGGTVEELGLSYASAGEVQDKPTPAPALGTAMETAEAGRRPKAYLEPPAFVWGHDSHDSVAADRGPGFREAKDLLFPCGR
jgi:hypothetical protein